MRCSRPSSISLALAVFVSAPLWPPGAARAQTVDCPATIEALGTFEPGPPDGKGLPRVHFKPLTTVPLTSWRLAPAGGEDVYVAGYNPRKRVSQLGLVGPSAEGKLLRVLYETQAQIADVAGDGKTTYFASGPAIWALGKDEGASVLWAHPKAAIRSIVAAPGGGVFYATDGGVGYAGASARPGNPGLNVTHLALPEKPNVGLFQQPFWVRMKFAIERS